MPIEVVPVIPGGGPLLSVETPLSTQQVPVFTTLPRQFGVFKNVSRSGAGTTEIVTPNPGGAIVLTDLIITASKTVTSDVTIQFDDGTNQEVIALSDSIGGVVNLAIAFAGLWRGWREADLDLVTTGNVVVNVTVGYFKVPDGLEFSDWDDMR